MAKIRDIASTLFNLGKGMGLEKPRRGHEAEYNLNKLLGKMQERNSLMRANRYFMEIAPPGWSNATDVETARDLMFFCEAVNLPGASVVPVDHKRLGIGPFDRRPSNIIPAEISATIMLDTAGRNLSFFQKWISHIVMMDAQKPGHIRGSDNASFGQVAYRATYLSPTIKIHTIDQAGNKIATLTAHECWPSLLGDVTLGWAQNDEYARAQVNFQLRYFTTEEFEPTAPGLERELSGFERLIRLGTAGKSLLASFKKPNNVGDAINILSNVQTFAGTLGGKRSAGG
tara:strand:+ start:666 stop:1523 length:858 start_codon:yes stop_codon:yes gene_type:complete